MIVVPPLACTVILDLLLVLLLTNKVIDKTSSGQHFSLGEDDFTKLYPGSFRAFFLAWIYKIQSSNVQNFLGLLLSVSETLGKLNLKWSPFLIIPKFLDFLGGWSLLLAFCMLSASILSEIIVLFIIKPRANQLTQIRIGSANVIPDSEQYWQSIEKDRDYFRTLEQLKQHSHNIYRRMSVDDSNDELSGRLNDVLGCLSSQNNHLNASDSAQSIPSKIYLVCSSLASSSRRKSPNAAKFSSIFYPKLLARLNLLVVSIDRELSIAPQSNTKDDVGYRAQLIKDIACWKQAKKKNALETLSMLSNIMRSFDLYHSAQQHCPMPSPSLSINQPVKPLLQIIKDDCDDLRKKLAFLPKIKIIKGDVNNLHKFQVNRATQFLFDTVDQLETFYNKKNCVGQDGLFFNQSLKKDTQSSYCYQTIHELHTFLDNCQLSSNKAELLLDLCRYIDNPGNSSMVEAQNQKTPIDSAWRHLASANRDHKNQETPNGWSLYAVV